MEHIRQKAKPWISWRSSLSLVWARNMDFCLLTQDGATRCWQRSRSEMASTMVFELESE
jgi:hypothetical protein